MTITYENNSVNMKIYRADFTKVINLYTKYVSIVRYIYQIYNCKFRVFGDFSEVTDSTMQVNVRTTREVGLKFKPDNEWHILDFGYSRMSIAPITVVDITTTLSFDYIEVEFSVDNQYIYCFNNTKEDIVVDKDISVNSFALRFRGTFRDNIDLINPIFDIEWTQIPTFNYVYLNMFGRYYFVDNIECVRNNLYRIYCSIDVLMSYREQLKDLQVYVTRQENNVNAQIPDMKLPIQNNMEYLLEPLTNVLPRISFPNDRDLHTHYYALTVVSVAPGKSIPAEEQDKIPTVYNKTSITLLLNSIELELVVKTILGASDIVTEIKQLWNDNSDAFISVKQFPWNLVLSTDIPTRYSKKWLIGSKEIDFGVLLHGVAYTNENHIWHEIKCGSYKFIRKYNDWRDFKPYTKITLFIPFVGWVELDNEEIYSENYQSDYIYFKYVIDVITGDCIFQIYNYIKDGVAIPTPENINQQYAYINIIAQYDCSPCDNVLISNSNHLEMLRKTVSTGANLIGGAVSAFATGGASLGMANALNMKQRGVRRSTKELAVDKARIGQANASNIASGSNVISNFVSDIISNTQNSKVFSTNTAGFINLNTRNQFLIKYERFVYKEPSGYSHIVGKPSSYSGKLGDLEGYTEVGAFHLEGINGITTEEKDLLESLLRSGIIM
uniref:Uncharacterized protein n=1 Tax=Podoviridae sp. cty7j44 TaxID=2826593 RepID=A0A8S5QXV5_9CAUD|nr:MAG TPA: hypothetical protein [Podoviridae sp. cty7j44]